MTAFDQFAVVACLGGVTLMGLLIYSDNRVKHYQKILDRLRAQREAAE